MVLTETQQFKMALYIQERRVIEKETNKLSISASTQEQDRGSGRNNSLQATMEIEKANNKVHIFALTWWLHFFRFLKYYPTIKGVTSDKV